MVLRLCLTPTVCAPSNTDLSLSLTSSNKKLVKPGRSALTSPAGDSCACWSSIESQGIPAKAHVYQEWVWGVPVCWPPQCLWGVIFGFRLPLCSSMYHVPSVRKWECPYSHGPLPRDCLVLTTEAVDTFLLYWNKFCSVSGMSPALFWLLDDLQ